MKKNRLLPIFCLWSLSVAGSDKMALLPSDGLVPVVQSYTESQADATNELGDHQIEVKKGEASQWEKNGGDVEGGIELSFDGDMTTLFHSPWKGTDMPVTLTYYFKKAESLDYLVYKPRLNGRNGAWGEVDVEIQQGGHFKAIRQFDLEQRQQSYRLDFAFTQKKVTAVRFVIRSGYNDMVSCAEMEFYQKNEKALGEIRKVFADDLCTELNTGIGQRQVSGIKNSFLKSLAQDLLDRKYDKEFRVQDYQAYRPLRDLAKELKTSEYQNFENPTGICFEPGEEVIVFVSDTHGEKLNLITSLGGGRIGTIGDSFLLYPGVNKVKFSAGGLGYIQYFTDNYRTAQPVKIHIAGGKVNGYFDVSKHKPEEWNDRLNKAVFDYFDLIGERIHVTYHVDDLRKYTPDGTDLINLYNDIVCMEHSIMGLPQYNRVPKNRMYISAVKSGMFAAGWGVGLERGIMNTVAVPDNVRKGKTWALAHELGHVNQQRPNLNWGGTAEVTNNIYSVLIRYHYTPNDINLEHETCWDGDGWKIPGGRFNSFLTYGVAKGEAWMYQRGQDNLKEHTDNLKGYADKGGDHFVKLCPLWQLFLYYRVMEGEKGKHYDWFANISEQERRSTDKFANPGDWQLKFMRSVCNEVDTDLTGFFEKVGMLKVYDNRFMDDYGKYYITISSSQIERLKKDMSGKKKPEALIHYISANSLDVYRYKKELQGGQVSEGVSVDGDAAVISHSVWQNAVVFETYKGKELTHVAIVGTGHGANKNRPDTKVHYPEGSTAIYAVGWNGKRLLVHGTPVLSNEEK